MKKLISVLIALILLLTACSSHSEPIEQQDTNELGEGSRILEGCIFKTAEEKYGVQTKRCDAGDHEHNCCGESPRTSFRGYLRSIIGILLPLCSHRLPDSDGLGSGRTGGYVLR